MSFWVPVLSVQSSSKVVSLNIIDWRKNICDSGAAFEDEKKKKGKVVWNQSQIVQLDYCTWRIFIHIWLTVEMTVNLVAYWGQST